jgi:hypothetical protein
LEAAGGLSHGIAYRLTKIKPKSHQRQLLHGEELGLVLPNVLSTVAVRRTVEVLRESFDEADACE